MDKYFATIDTEDGYVTSIFEASNEKEALIKGAQKASLYEVEDEEGELDVKEIKEMITEAQCECCLISLVNLTKGKVIYDVTGEM